MNSCTVCLHPLTISSVSIRLPCGHIFHRICMSRMIRAGRSQRAGNIQSSNCPLCRAAFPRDERQFTPISSGLPEGEATDLAELEADYNTAGGSVNQDSGWETQPRVGRRLQQEEHRWNSVDPSVNGELLSQLTTSELKRMYIQFGTTLLEAQKKIQVRLSELEDRLVEGEEYSDVGSRAILTGITLEQQQLMIENDHLRFDLTRARGWPTIRSNVDTAWRDPWFDEHDGRFLGTQSVLSRRVNNLRRQVEGRLGTTNEGQRGVTAIIAVHLLLEMIHVLDSSWAFLSET